MCLLSHDNDTLSFVRLSLLSCALVLELYYDYYCALSGLLLLLSLSLYLSDSSNRACASLAVLAHWTNQYRTGFLQQRIGNGVNET